MWIILFTSLWIIDISVRIWLFKFGSSTPGLCEYLTKIFDSGSDSQLFTTFMSWALANFNNNNSIHKDPGNRGMNLTDAQPHTDQIWTMLNPSRGSYKKRLELQICTENTTRVEHRVIFEAMLNPPPCHAREWGLSMVHIWAGLSIKCEQKMFRFTVKY